MMLVLFGLQGNSEGDGSDGEDNTWPGRQEVGQPEDQIQGDKLQFPTVRVVLRWEEVDHMTCLDVFTAC